MAEWIGLSPDDMDQMFDDLVKKFAIETALDGQNIITAITPVDTGRLRANWHISVGTPSEKVGGAQGVPDGIGSLANFQIGQTIWLQNNVEYGPYVNNGTQRFEGYFMVERTLAQLAD